MLSREGLAIKVYNLEGGIRNAALGYFRHSCDGSVLLDKLT